MGWSKENFNRLTYDFSDPILDRAKRIELVVLVDGKELIHVEAGEPGMLSFISRPEDQGITIDLIRPGGKRYTDYAVPEKQADIRPWHLAAMGIDGSDSQMGGR